MAWALYFNKKTNDIEVFPLSEESSYSSDQIDQYFSNHPDVEQWAIYSNFPTEEDIDDFEKAGGFYSSGEEEDDDYSSSSSSEDDS